MYNSFFVLFPITEFLMNRSAFNRLASSWDASSLMDSSYFEVVIFRMNYVSGKERIFLFPFAFLFFPIDSQHKWKIDLGLCRTKSENIRTRLLWCWWLDIRLLWSWSVCYIWSQRSQQIATDRFKAFGHLLSALLFPFHSCVASNPKLNQSYERSKRWMGCLLSSLLSHRRLTQENSLAHN